MENTCALLSWQTGDFVVQKQINSYYLNVYYATFQSDVSNCNCCIHLHMDICRLGMLLFPLMAVLSFAYQLLPPNGAYDGRHANYLYWTDQKQTPLGWSRISLLSPSGSLNMELLREANPDVRRANKAKGVVQYEPESYLKFA